MKKYKVYGTYTITIAKEVWANNEDEAIDKAAETFGGVIEYCGNGGDDKLVGVGNDDESVAADGDPEWGAYIEELEDAPDYRECPNCYEQLEEYEGDNGEKFWKCEDGCGTCYDEDYNEVDPDDYFDE